MARTKTMDPKGIMIDKGIPLPDPKRGIGPSPWFAIIKSLEVGDSFVVPNEKVANNLYNYFRKCSMKCTAREIDAGFYRVWRSA